MQKRLPSKPGFPFSVLIHRRTDTRGFANPKFEPEFEPGGLSITRNASVLPRVGIKHLKQAFFRPSYQTLIPLPPYLVTEICCALQAAYPAGNGSVAILRSMPLNNRRVRWLSASSNQ
jgi:hypothetical protein